MYDWGVRDSERQKRDRDGERQREAKRGAPLVRKHAHRRSRRSLRTGTRGHGHARTQMNLRAARHAGTPSRIEKQVFMKTEHIVRNLLLIKRNNIACRRVRGEISKIQAYSKTVLFFVSKLNP